MASHASDPAPAYTGQGALPTNHPAMGGVGSIPRDFNVSLPEQIAERLAGASQASGLSLQDMMTVAVNLFLSVDEARRCGGRLEVKTPGRDDLTFTLLPYSKRHDG